MQRQSEESDEMKKEYLPHRISREGYLPDRMAVQYYPGDKDLCRKECLAKNQTLHYHMASDGGVTVFTPLSAGTNWNISGQKGEGSEIPEKYRTIRILIQGEVLNEAQKKGLIRLLQGIQREYFRLYGQSFPFARKNLVCPEKFPIEELLEEGQISLAAGELYRVQTGVYRSRRDAEDKIQQLQDAGIAAYIARVQSP